MRLIYRLLFLTLVLSSVQSNAAPQTTTTVETTPMDAESDPDLASVDPEKIGVRANFILQTSLGFSGGNYLEADEYQQGPALFVRYLPLEKGDQVWGYQWEMNTGTIMGFSVGRRWYCCPEEEYMPYFRASAGLFIKGADDLAGLIEIRRMRIRGSVGIGENFISEFGVGYALTGPDLFAQFGYNISF